MITICQALLGEHAVFYKQFEILEEMLEYERSLERLLFAVRPIAKSLITHAQIENEILIPELDKVMGPSGPQTVARMDHEVIDSDLMNLMESRSLEEFKKRLPEVLINIRSHFAMEEEALFVMARETLSSERLTALGEFWAEQRKVMVR
jgi:hemerythrin superfamily protein